MRGERGTSTGPRRFRARGCGLSLIVLLSVVWGCGAPTRDPGTAVYASGADLESGDPLITVHPLARQIQRHALYVTLVRFDSTLRMTPYFASAWRWSADRRTLTFDLVPDLHWHDGPATTSADVVFTLERARDPATGFPRAADLSSLTRVSAEDPYRVTLDFASPQADVPVWLGEFPIVPAHRLREIPPADQRRGAFGDAPVGNGPFRFVERVRGQRWTFARNADFPASLGGPPPLSRLVVAVVDEATTKFAGLVSGELHVAGIAPTMADLVERDARLRVATYPVLFTTGLVFNSARPPLDDVRVRRAIDLAVDRARIIEVTLAGYGVPASGPVAPDNPLAFDRPVAHDPDAARALLNSAGWTATGGTAPRVRGGRPLRLTLLTVGSADNAVEQLIQDDLARIGIALEIRQLELGAFLTVARAPEKSFDLLITGIPGDLSLAYLAAMFDTRLAGGALDYAAFHTSELDAAFTDAGEATTADARAAAWTRVQRALARDLPVAWLWHARGVQGLSARLQGVRMDLRGEMATVARWSLAPADAP